MQFVSAFLMATAFSYLAALVFAKFFKKPALAKINMALQSFLYFSLFLLNFVAVMLHYFSDPSLILLCFVLAIFYSFSTVSSFIGLQVWMAYWKDNPSSGSPIGQIGMAFWNLALAVCYFSLL